MVFLKLPFFLILFFSFLQFACVTDGLDPLTNKVSKNSEEKEDFYWLEKVKGRQALNWVKKQNQTTLKDLTKEPNYKVFLAEAEKIFSAEDRLIYGVVRGDYIYNFWQDKKHPRGLWRRMPFVEYQKKGRPQDSDWEVLIDIDELAEAEGKNWVYKGVHCLPTKSEKCLVRLSRGGTDSSIYREFDVTTKSFVKNGFKVPQAKSQLSWIDEDSLYIATKLKENDVTTSGYPRILRLWKRGEKLEQAQVVHEAPQDSVGVFGFKAFGKSEDHRIFVTKVDFYKAEYYYAAPTLPEKRQIFIPETSEFENLHKDQMILRLRHPWKHQGQVFQSGSLVAVDLKVFRDVGKISVTTLYISFAENGPTGSFINSKCSLYDCLGKCSVKTFSFAI